jgi:hypothetical protein
VNLSMLNYFRVCVRPHENEWHVSIDYVMLRVIRCVSIIDRSDDEYNVHVSMEVR